MRSDLAWMQQAQGLARRALGSTWPNPSVGCVLVGNGRLLGYGCTQPGGRPHAEAVALETATTAFGHDALRGATAYVTLEPCSHHGRTPPCAEALIASGIARVVVGLRDPDPRVNGRGIATLSRAGISVEEGVGADVAGEIVAGFVMRTLEGRPLITLKLATSLDGKIAMPDGESRWVTGPDARAVGHGLRLSHDAVLVGVQTAIDDDPDLTCRLPGLDAQSRVRIVLDSRARLPPQSRLAQTARDKPVWLVSGPGAEQDRLAALEAAGVRIVRAPIGDGGLIDLRDAVRILGDLGLTRVLVEGGSTVAAGFIARNLVDRLAVFRSGLVLGSEARSAVGALSLAGLSQAPRYRSDLAAPAGDDRIEIWRADR